ncbi:MAG: hypothetical protein QNJ78_06355 [Gammaproteobacteria bacterium]|nr:hypothetical protein [Gammaproteobacteria bacterium]
MGRPALPKNVHILKGTGKKNPDRMRKRENEPEPKKPLGRPPPRLTAGQKKCWRELQKIVPDGVLGDCDAWAVELACVLMDEFRTNPLEFSAAKLTRLEALLGKFGMTPADRAKISVPKGREKNRFDDD